MAAGSVAVHPGVTGSWHVLGAFFKSACPQCKTQGLPARCPDPSIMRQVRKRNLRPGFGQEAQAQCR
jgi:hypothetical protein